jgi:hypothetical protein
MNSAGEGRGGGRSDGSLPGLVQEARTRAAEMERESHMGY